MDYRLTDIPAELWRQFKSLCAQHGVTMREALLALIAGEVEQEARAGEQKKKGRERD